MSQSSYFKSRPDAVDIGGSWRGKLEILKNAYNCRRYVIHVDRTGSALFGGVRGWGSVLWLVWCFWTC